MPHLSFEYSAELGRKADLGGLAAALRDAMLETGIFPLGGIRVRGHACDIAVVADGSADLGFIHMICSIGAGRDAAAKAEAAETIYAAAEAWVRAHLGDEPLALSLNLQEMEPALSIKRYNMVKERIAKAAE